MSGSEIPTGPITRNRRCSRGMVLSALLWVLLLPSVCPVAAAAATVEIPPPGTYPWRAETTTNVHLRKGPGKVYASLGVFDPGALVIVDAPVPNSDWVKVSFRDKVQGPMEGFVHAGYLHFINQLYPQAPEKKEGPLRSVLAAIWKVLKWILIIGVVLLVLAFKEELLALAAPALVFGGIGALLFWIVFHNGGLGFLLGLIGGVLFGLRDILDVGAMGGVFRWTIGTGYYLISLPFYLLNQLQFFLSEPWRCFFKRHRFTDSTNDVLRPLLEGLKVLLYIVLTPLRAVNAVYFNIVVHGVTEIYDLVLEVFAPSSENEGEGDFWKWLLLLPWRILKYPVFHGVLALVEGVVWTVIDIFLPAVTLYHGTDLTAARNIAGSRGRNEDLRWLLGWDSGTFRASQSSWGGIGVYFAPRRLVALRYANDPYRLSDANPVLIVCRVSLGRIINYSLAPWKVYLAAGGEGHPPTLNRYGEQNHYTTGEWWNDRGGYWEYCLFDWQNRYNHPWRIRPVYLYNHRTKMIQHIPGGKAHWLFSKL